jgi:o-succinylbenzoate synthase
VRFFLVAWPGVEEMIRFSYLKYELQPMTDLNSRAAAQLRKGALLKCEWPNQQIGFADCHPWAEYGDADIDLQIRSLARGHVSGLLEQTIWLARKDAMMRVEQRNGFEGGEKVKNHFLVQNINKLDDRSLDEIKSNGFSTLKIKVGRDHEQEVEQLIRILKLSPFKVRLDFNSSGDFSVLERFMYRIEPGLRARIEFVEDPFPYDEESWSDANKIVPLAADFECENIDWKKMKKPPFQVLIVKPARMDVDKALNRCSTFGLKAVVTSSMDHSLGVAHSAVVAMEIKRAHPNLLLECGCLSLRSYRPDEFSNKIVVQGPYIVRTSGYGVGFDELLKQASWVPLEMELQ